MHRRLVLSSPPPHPPTISVNYKNESTRCWGFSLYNMDKLLVAISMPPVMSVLEKFLSDRDRLELDLELAERFLLNRLEARGPPLLVNGDYAKKEREGKQLPEPLAVQLRNLRRREERGQKNRFDWIKVQRRIRKQRMLAFYLYHSHHVTDVDKLQILAARKRASIADEPGSDWCTVTVDNEPFHINLELLGHEDDRIDIFLDCYKLPFDRRLPFFACPYTSSLTHHDEHRSPRHAKRLWTVLETLVCSAVRVLRHTVTGFRFVTVFTDAEVVEHLIGVEHEQCRMSSDIRLYFVVRKASVANGRSRYVCDPETFDNLAARSLTDRFELGTDESSLMYRNVTLHFFLINDDECENESDEYANVFLPYNSGEYVPWRLHRNVHTLRFRRYDHDHMPPTEMFDDETEVDVADDQKTQAINEILVETNTDDDNDDDDEEMCTGIEEEDESETTPLLTRFAGTSPCPTSSSEEEDENEQQQQQHRKRKRYERVMKGCKRRREITTEIARRMNEIKMNGVRVHEWTSVRQHSTSRFFAVPCNNWAWNDAVFHVIDSEQHRGQSTREIAANESKERRLLDLYLTHMPRHMYQYRISLCAE